VITRAVPTLTVSAITGASIWLLTPVLTSHREPWDADGSFYIIALLIAGAVAGVVTPKPLWAHYAGAFVGQLGYELLFLRAGPLVAIGAVFLLGYCWVYAVAAALGGFVRGCMEKKFSSSD